MKQPENLPRKYETLFSDIDSGRIKIPQFQREFVWDKSKTAKLIDSLLKGYPIGTFIFWKTREKLRSLRNIGNVDLPETPNGEPTVYVLDGQQRITSLYAIRKGVRITRDGETLDYKDILIDLTKPTDTDEEVVVVEVPLSEGLISVHDLLTLTIGEFVSRHPRHIDAIDAYRKRLTGYDFSTIGIDDYPIDTACEIFTRINTGGKELNLFEIMVARTYDHARGFDLSKKYDDLVSNSDEKSLETVSYDTVPPITILQCAFACTAGGVQRKTMLMQDRGLLVDAWVKVESALFSSIDYARTHLGVAVSRLLPYNVLLVPLTYFFFHAKSPSPTAKQHRLLRQYFYWASLTNRFASSVERSVETDLNKMKRIIEGEAPDYPISELTIDPATIATKQFSGADAFCKAVIAALVTKQPRSLKTNGQIIVGNDWLKTASSKNYHHFFPKAFLKKNGCDALQANVLANITIIDDALNKRDIRDKAPSAYLKDFASGNPELSVSLASHLIDDFDAFGLNQDDYGAFVQKRSFAIASQLNDYLAAR